jgi:hypothetical protein
MRGLSKGEWVAGLILAATVGMAPAFSQTDSGKSLEDEMPAAGSLVKQAKEVVKMRVERPKAAALGAQEFRSVAVALGLAAAAGPKPLCGPSYAYISIQSDPPDAYVYGQDNSYWGKTADGSGVRRLFECGYDESDTKFCPNPYTITLSKSGYKSVTHTFPLNFRYVGDPDKDGKTWDCQDYENRAWQLPPQEEMVVLQPLNTY